MDLQTGQRWNLRPNRGKLPWWLLDKSRRVPGTKISDYFEPLKLAFAKTGLQQFQARSILHLCFIAAYGIRYRFPP